MIDYYQCTQRTINMSNTIYWKFYWKQLTKLDFPTLIIKGFRIGPIQSFNRCVFNKSTVYIISTVHYLHRAGYIITSSHHQQLARANYVSLNKNNTLRCYNELQEYKTGQTVSQLHFGDTSWLHPTLQSMMDCYSRIILESAVKRRCLTPLSPLVDGHDASFTVHFKALRLIPEV